jgi:hypothetical protein
MSLKSKDIFRTKLTPVTEHNLSVAVKDAEMIVRYDIKTWRALYDISDINGRILLKGELNAEETTIALNDLKPATYILWIVDGADLLKYNFTIK